MRACSSWAGLRACDAAVADGELAVAISQPLRLAGAAWGGAMAEQWASRSGRWTFSTSRQTSPRCPADAEFIAAEHACCTRPFGAHRRAATIGWLGELHPKHPAKFEGTTRAG